MPVVLEVRPGVYQKSSQVAHIYGIRPGAPCYRPELPAKERDSFANLLLLCIAHHEEVDGKDGESRYPPETLRKWKAQHEGAAGSVLKNLTVPIALVIKAGRAFFAEPDGGGWLYRGRNDELSYWLSHSLPVVLLGHDPNTGLTYWQHFTPDTITYTNQSWKIRIPPGHVLGPDAHEAFAAIAGGRRTSKYWAAAARTVARAEAITATPVSQPSQEGFLVWVGTLVDRFQHAVETATPGGSCGTTSWRNHEAS